MFGFKVAVLCVCTYVYMCCSSRFCRGIEYTQRYTMCVVCVFKSAKNCIHCAAPVFCAIRSLGAKDEKSKISSQRVREREKKILFQTDSMIENHLYLCIFTALYSNNGRPNPSNSDKPEAAATQGYTFLCCSRLFWSFDIQNDESGKNEWITLYILEYKILWKLYTAFRKL